MNTSQFQVDELSCYFSEEEEGLRLHSSFRVLPGDLRWHLADADQVFQTQTNEQLLVLEWISGWRRFGVKAGVRGEERSSPLPGLLSFWHLPKSGHSHFGTYVFLLSQCQPPADVAPCMWGSRPLQPAEEANTFLPFCLRVLDLKYDLYGIITSESHTEALWGWWCPGHAVGMCPVVNWHPPCGEGAAVCVASSIRCHLCWTHVET